MTGFTQKYTIVQFFDDIQEGYEFSSSDWPLHSTVVDTFAIDWSIGKTAEILKGLLSTYEGVTSKAGDDRYFGENGQVQVTLIDRTESLLKLHRDILTALEAGGIILNDPQFAHDGFLPHATVQKNAHLNDGESVKFGSLSIVDMFPDKDPYRRKVLKTIEVGSAATSRWDIPRVERLVTD